MCLLVLALPLQGLAAQRMLFCTPAQHAPTQAQEHHDHAAHGQAEHSKVDAKADVGHGKCSVCASCCAAMALVPAPLSFEPAPPSPDYTSNTVSGYSGQTPGRLDRPPRSPLA